MVFIMYHLYIVFGVNENCKRFRNECISDDIINTIGVDTLGSSLPSYFQY